MDVKHIKNQAVNWANHVARRDRKSTEQGAFEAIFSYMQQTPSATSSKSTVKNDNREAISKVDSQKPQEQPSKPHDEDVMADASSVIEQDEVNRAEEREALAQDATASSNSAQPQENAPVAEGASATQAAGESGAAAETATTVTTTPATGSEGQQVTTLPLTNVLLPVNGQVAVSLSESANQAVVLPQPVPASTPTLAAEAQPNPQTATMLVETVGQETAMERDDAAQVQSSNSALKEATTATETKIIQPMQPTTGELTTQTPAIPITPTETASQSTDADTAGQIKVSASVQANATTLSSDDASEQETTNNQNNHAGQRQDAWGMVRDVDLKVNEEPAPAPQPRQTAAQTAAQGRSHQLEQARIAQESVAMNDSVGTSSTASVTTPETPIVTAAATASEMVSAGLLKTDAPTASVIPSGNGLAGQTQPTEPQARRNIEEIVKSAQTAVARNSSRIQLRLDPPELGLLRVEIRSGQDGMRLEMQATTVKAHELLKQHSSELKNALEQQGLPAVRIEIQLRMDLQDNPSHSSSDQQPGGRQAPSQQQQGQFQQEMRQPSQGQSDGRGSYREPAFAVAAGEAAQEGWQEMNFARLDVNG